MRKIKIFFTFLITMSLLSMTMLTIDLETKHVLNNMVSIKIPKGFKELSEQERNQKFPPGKVPSVAFTNETGDVNITLNHTPSPSNQEKLTFYKNNFVKMFNAYGSKCYDSGIENIHNKKVAFIKLEMKDRGKIQNTTMFFTDLDETLLICTFYCPSNKIKEWEETADKIVHSLKIK